MTRRRRGTGEAALREALAGTSGGAGETASGGAGGTAGTAGEVGAAGNAGQAGSAGEGRSAGSGGGLGDIWVNAYHAAWMQETLPPSEIRFEALSHVTHLAFVPNADGKEPEHSGCEERDVGSCHITDCRSLGPDGGPSTKSSGRW